MRAYPLPTLRLLTCAALLGCPSDDAPGGRAETDDVEPTGATESSGAEPTSATSMTSPPDSTETGSTSDTDASVAAECPDYAALDLDELLVAGPGEAIVGEEARAVRDVEFADFDGTTAIVAVLDDDTFVVLPLDETGEGSDGTVLLLDGDDVYAGEASVEIDDAAEGLSFDEATVTLEGGGVMLTLSACFLVGAGSSTFELAGAEATVRGALGSLTFAQVERLQAEHPEIERLILADVPGSINDEVNVETGRLVRNGGWSTHIPADGEIASGGVDLFCAGVDRTLDDGARIGVHSWSNGEEEGADLPMDSPEHAFFLAYLGEMLGDPIGADFYWFTLQAAPAADIHWMTPAEIAEHQLLTE